MAVMDRTLSATLKAAMAEHAEQLVVAYQEGMAQQQQIRAALDSLTVKARSVLAVLTDPNLDPARWQEPAVFAAFRRTLILLVKKAVVSEGTTSRTYFVQLSVTTDPLAEPDSGPVVRMGTTRARVCVDSRLIVTEPVKVKKENREG
jgi:hypothetical protein